MMLTLLFRCSVSSISDVHTKVTVYIVVYEKLTTYVYIDITMLHSKCYF